MLSKTRPQNEPRLFKFACCNERWLDRKYTSHCGHCRKWIPAVGRFDPDDDVPEEWGVDDE